MKKNGESNVTRDEKIYNREVLSWRNNSWMYHTLAANVTGKTRFPSWLHQLWECSRNSFESGDNQKCFILFFLTTRHIFFRGIAQFFHNGIHNNDTIRYAHVSFSTPSPLPPFVFPLLSEEECEIAYDKPLSRQQQLK